MLVIAYVSQNCCRVRSILNQQHGLSWTLSPAKFDRQAILRKSPWRCHLTGH